MNFQKLIITAVARIWMQTAGGAVVITSDSNTTANTVLVNITASGSTNAEIAESMFNLGVGFQQATDRVQAKNGNINNPPFYPNKL